MLIEANKGYIIILGSIPEKELRDPELDLGRTAARSANAFSEMMSTYDRGTLEELDDQWRAFPSKWVHVSTPVVQPKIRFYSLCAHHLLPFFGYVDIGYYVGDNRALVGLSKLSRVVHYFSHMLQTQERMTTMVADYIFTKLHPEALYAHSVARHLCMEMRGPKQESLTHYTVKLGEVDLIDSDPFMPFTEDRP